MIRFNKIVDGEFTIFEVTGKPGDKILVTIDNDRLRENMACCWYYKEGTTETYLKDGTLFATRYPGTFSKELGDMPKGEYYSHVKEDFLYYCMSKTNKTKLDVEIFRLNDKQITNIAKGNTYFVAEGSVTIYTSSKNHNVVAPAFIKIISEDVKIESNSDSISFRLK